MYNVALLVALAGISVEAGRIVGNDGCCLPKQMTMVEGMVLGQVKQGQGSITVGGLFIGMDQDKQKIFANMSLSIDGKEIATYVLQDFAGHMQYAVTGGNCTKSRLGAWVPKCVPQGSVNMGSAYYGHAGRLNGVKVDSYMYTDGTNTAYFSMTQERTCLPIVETAYGSNANGPYTLTLGFVNSTMRVDPALFNVPAACRKPAVPFTSQPHPFGGSILFR